MKRKYPPKTEREIEIEEKQKQNKPFYNKPNQCARDYYVKRDEPLQKDNKK